MIYTVTANPSIDYIVQLANLNVGEVNRMDYDTKLPGGKGINVSRILKQIDTPSNAWGFLGGFTGDFIEKALREDQLETSFIHINGDTRINIKLKANQETEINGQGPVITDGEITNFKAQFTELKPGDTVIMSGSLPPNLPKTFYKSLIPIIKEKGADFVIDTTGQALLDTLADHPLVIKPNHHELAELFGVELPTLADRVTYGRKLLEKGAQHVLISMAGEGALLVTADAAYMSHAPKGTVINSVGAGDSMLAGFVGTYAKTKDPLASFKMGLACGSATAFSEDLANRQKIDEIFSKIQIEKFN